MSDDALERDAITTWRSGGEAGDARVSSAALADDVVLVSPLTDRFTFEGRAEVETLLTSVFEVFTGIRYMTVYRDADHAVLIGVGTVRGLRLEEIQQHGLDSEGRIRRITIVMRPLPAATAFLRELGPHLARRQNRPLVAVVLRIAGAVLDNVASMGDRVFVPLVSPVRQRRSN